MGRSLEPHTRARKGDVLPPPSPHQVIRPLASRMQLHKVLRVQDSTLNYTYRTWHLELEAAAMSCCPDENGLYFPSSGAALESAVSATVHRTARMESMMSWAACAITHGKMKSPEFCRISSGNAESTETQTGNDF